MFWIKIFFLLIVFSEALGVCPPIIKTKAGKVRGRIAKTVRHKKTYYAFHGIPYAEPPIDDLRFMPPVEKKHWDGILRATHDKPMCIQIHLSTCIVQEDCLYLNVYTPTLKKQNLPVMVWLYGGAFILGDSSYASYGPDLILEKDVVFVDFNYRTGIFGFYSTEDEVAPGNAGLKDQVLALKWIHDNIAFFGGNPQNVTLFGQSAGAVSINYLMQTPQTKGLFQKAILQSGSAINLWSLARNKRNSVFHLANILQISTNDTRKMLKDMQELPAIILMYASLIIEVAIMTFNNPLDGLLFSPTVEPDHSLAIVTNRSFENFRTGNFHRIPTIIGYNNFEGGLFYPARSLLRLYLTHYYGEYVTRFTPIDMHITNNKTKEFVGNLIASRYDIDSALFSSDDNIYRFISDDQFVRPMNKIAHLQSKYAPVYFYRFSYRDDFLEHPTKGITHTRERLLLFIREKVPVISARDALHRERMTRLWTNFAKTANPTPYTDEILQNVTWTSVTPQKQSYLEIGDDLVLGVDPDKEAVFFWEKLYKKYGHPPYDTY